MWLNLRLHLKTRPLQASLIKAEVINVAELLEIGSWKDAKEKGKVRLEGKDYTAQDKDVIEFKVAV